MAWEVDCGLERVRFHLWRGVFGFMQGVCEVVGGFTRVCCLGRAWVMLEYCVSSLFFGFLGVA